MKLEDFPDEILLAIIRIGTPANWLQWAGVDWKMRTLALDHTKTVQKLDIAADFLKTETSGSKRVQRVDFSLMAFCLKSVFPNLTSLSLRGCPVLLAKSDLALLASSVPSLVGLDIGQRFGQPRFCNGALLALPDFKNLKKFSMDGKPLGGTSYRVELPPLHQMPQLIHLAINCKSGMLFRLIRVFQAMEFRFPNLCSLKLCNRAWVMVNAVDLNLLIWFLDSHSETLADVELCDFSFENRQNSDKVVRSLLGMKKLKTLSLNSCFYRAIGGQFDEEDIRRKLQVQCTNLHRLTVSGNCNLLDDFFLLRLKAMCPSLECTIDIE